MRSPESSAPLSLREQVETLLPAWQSWYPSLFDAAQDLGLIRARVCAPALLALSNRHADVRNEAMQAFRERWCVEDEPAPVANALLKNRVPQGRPRNDKSKAGARRSDAKAER